MPSEPPRDINRDDPPFDWRSTLMLTAAFAVVVIAWQIFT